MTTADSALFGIHGAALTLRAQRMALLASNIANAATPGYKARDIDFTRALDAATSGNAGSASAAAGGAVRYRVPVQDSLDGNTVELATEQTQFAENAVAYKTTLTFLQSRIDTVMQALKGDGS
ncbi:MAG TPA: flagellar basal body rod protein FlgB [Sphingomonas sp.]